MNEKTLSELRIVTHPIRVDILIDLDSDQTVSPKQFAGLHGLPVENVAYHFRVLRDRGLIKLKRAVPVRGTLEHHYALTAQGRKGLARFRLLWELAS